MAISCLLCFQVPRFITQNSHDTWNITLQFIYSPFFENLSAMELNRTVRTLSNLLKSFETAESCSLSEVSVRISGENIFSKISSENFLLDLVWLYVTADNGTSIFSFLDHLISKIPILLFGASFFSCFSCKKEWGTWIRIIFRFRRSITETKQPIKMKCIEFKFSNPKSMFCLIAEKSVFV